MRSKGFYQTGILTAFFFLLVVQGCSQQKSDLKSYETSNYKISYRSDWLVSNDRGIVNIYPKDEYGSVTISFHSGITFPLEETKSFILEMNEIVDSPDKVKMEKTGELVKFTHDFINKTSNHHWFTKAIRKGTDFFLITINCEEGQ